VRRRAVVWLALGALYGVFLIWYGGGGGPLSEPEVERYVEKLREGGADPERLAKLRDFLARDDGKPFVMANFIHFREVPLPVGDVRPGESSRQVLDRYMAHMVPALLRRGCHPVIAGAVLARSFEVWGIEGGADWSLVGLVRYRSRRDMIEIATDPAFRDAHAYKEAAMAQTIAIPLEPAFLLGDARWGVGLGLLVIGGLVQQLLRARRSS
jgi:hypothetical protein